MTPSSVLSLVFLSTCLLALPAFGDVKPCPFNKDACTCFKFNDSSPIDYDYVECVWPTRPDLKDPSGSKYTVESLSITSDDLDLIPGYYLASAFSSITQVSLALNGSNSDQHWDDQAFDNVKIQKILVYNFDNMIPLPNALRRVGVRGLTQLLLSSSKVSLRLGSNTFSDFKSLSTFGIYDIPILQLSDDAFSGLEQSLKELTLDDVHLHQFPVTALSRLSQLSLLSLDGSDLPSIPSGALASFPKLQTLSLSNNMLASDIEGGSLDSLPPSLKTLFLDNVGFKAVPRRVLEKNLGLTGIFLRDNVLESLHKQDFSLLNGSLETIALSGNAIAQVDPGAFDHTTTKDGLLIVLTGTAIQSADLAMFSGASLHTGGVLNHNMGLKSLTISSTDQVQYILSSAPRHAPVSSAPFQFPTSASIQVIDTALETIDQKIGDLLYHNPNVTLDISKNVHLQCSGLNWLAWHVICANPSPVKVDDSVCADKSNQPLIDYLRSVQTGPCGSSPPPPAGAPSMASSIRIHMAYVILTALFQA